MESSQISLSYSSSSRLRNNGSLKNNQASSPNQMFPSLNVKKRSSNGGGFENTEPSSPKVSCIGQVRVKSKIKQARKNRTATRSKSCRRNLSFRKLDGGAAKGGDFEIPNYQFQQQEGFSDRNQRWVHFPATICRAFGAEFNCFLPCKSFSCMAANESEKEEDKMSRSEVVAQWLVAVQDGHGEGEIEENVMTSHRRHVFEELDIENFVQENNNNSLLGNDNCIVPPKNALLLMRFRSDPVKMETLANKVWDCPQGGDFDGEKDEEEKRGFFSTARNSLSEENAHIKVEIFMHRKEECTIEVQESEIVSDSICNGLNESIALVGEGEDNDKAVQEDQVEEEIESSGYALNGDVMVDQCKLGNQENENANGFDEVLVLRENESGEEESIDPIIVEKEELGIGFDEAENESKLLGEDHKLEKEELLEENGVEAVAIEESLDEVPESPEETRERSEPELDQKKQETKQNVVPDCLWLMMREPKLSMEVSKETWICESSDFIRPPKSKHVNNHDPKKRSILDSKPNSNLQLQPPRSSCSFPAAPPLKTILNRGLESTMSGSRAYELFELPRCKSEPRWSSAKLGPEACFWKNRKLEPHCPATTLGF